MKLFAPREDFSEKGSLRAPSPEPTEEGGKQEVADDTPKPLKPDPLSQPTPRVIGAYVDTPVTVKVETPDNFDVLHGVIDQRDSRASTERLIPETYDVAVPDGAGAPLSTNTELRLLLRI